MKLSKRLNFGINVMQAAHSHNNGDIGKGNPVTVRLPGTNRTGV
jgi:hypothetical protein